MQRVEITGGLSVGMQGVGEIIRPGWWRVLLDWQARRFGKDDFLEFSAADVRVIIGKIQHPPHR